MIAQTDFAPERDFRRPGCTDACRVIHAVVPGRFGRTDLLLHDPDVHETYGRLAAGLPYELSVIQTGSLRIDLRTREAWSQGGLLELTVREWEILAYLATCRGAWCSRAELMAGVWGAQWGPSASLVTTNLSRLRDKLGVNAPMIENRTGFGYRLRQEPAITTALSEQAPARRPRRWAKEHDACVACGTTARQHAARGLCSTCRNHRRRRATS